MKKIKIMTDSASDIPAELEAEYSIRILPFPVTVGDSGYLERVDFSNHEFYDMLTAATKIPTTAQITTLQFYEEFKAIQKEGYQEVIYISINGKASSTHGNALMARTQFFDKYPALAGAFKIHIVDSATYSAAYGYPVVEAAKKALKGSSSTEIISYLEDWFDSVEIYFAPYTLEFVKKSGRVPVAAAFVGELIGLRPIISIIDGETKIEEKVRGDKAIIPTLLKYAKAGIVPKTPYMLVKGLLEAEAEELFDKSSKELGYPAACNHYVGASISINAGPKVVGIIIKGRNRKNNSH